MKTYRFIKLIVKHACCEYKNEYEHEYKVERRMKSGKRERERERESWGFVAGRASPEETRGPSRRRFIRKGSDAEGRGARGLIIRKGRGGELGKD
jgi:hypothetical protein